MSPEVYIKSKCSTKSDVWAVGIILLEMLIGDLPFRGMEYDHFLTQIANGEAFRNLSCSQQTKFILSKLLNIEVEKRIDAVEAYNLLAALRFESVKPMSTTNHPASINSIENQIFSSTQPSTEHNTNKPTSLRK